MKKLITLSFAVGTIFSAPVFANANSNFYTKISAGLSHLSSDGQSEFDEFEDSNSQTYKLGSVASLAFGYIIDPKYRVEIAYEKKENVYRYFTSDIATNRDYITDTLFVNGYYNFENIGDSSFKPYVGFGLGYANNIELKIEDDSFDSSGSLALQGIAGIAYELSNNWELNSDLKYTAIPSFDLKNKSGGDDINGVGQSGYTLNFGVTYKF